MILKKYAKNVIFEIEKRDRISIIGTIYVPRLLT